MAASGNVIEMTIRRSNSYQIIDPGPHVVTIGPGESAYFGLGWIDTNLNGDSSGCLSPAIARAIPPNDTMQLSTPVSFDALVCPSGGAAVTAVAPQNAFSPTSP